MDDPFLLSFRKPVLVLLLLWVVIGRGQEKIPEEIPLPLKSSSVDPILWAPRNIQLTTQVVRTGDTTLPGVLLKYARRQPGSSWAILSDLGMDRANEHETTNMRIKAGAEYFLLSGKIGLLGGYSFGGEYYRPQATGYLSGSFLGTDFLLSKFELSRPLLSNQSLVQSGVAESQWETYAEKQVSEFVDISGAISVLSTHRMQELNLGKGIELSTRIGLGPSASRFRLGPWAYFVRWGTNSDAIQQLLVHQYTIVGAFSSYIWGAARPFSFRGKISAGWGHDLSQNEKTMGVAFIEAGAERLLTQGFGLKAEYALYTGQITDTIGGATHFGRLHLFLAL